MRSLILGTRMKAFPTGRTEDHFRVVLYCGMVLVVYVLSVGPVLVSADRWGVSQTRFAHPLRSFYYPVLSTARLGHAGTRAYENYVGLWHWILLGRALPEEAKFK